jgi:predicted O-methyltransferase YrrM
MKNDLSANEIDKKVQEYLQYFDVNPLLSRLKNVPDGQRLEVLNMTGQPNLYYQYLSCLVRAVKPDQILELGASIGVSTIMMATQMKEGAVLYSVDDASDYKEGPKDWSALDREYPNVIQVVGNDLDLSIYPKDFDISKTDILFIDTLHYGGQLMKELITYGPLVKKGCIILMDDIRTNDMYQIWEGIKDDKIDLTYPCHYSGFGMVVKG